ncbi:unnamed protein product [Agarophyton chilense]
MPVESDRHERKRKWDAPPSPDPALRPPPHADTPFREFEINDHPGRRFAMMSANIKTVEARHNVVIVSKGRYISPAEPPPPPDAPDHERKLFLKIRGNQAADVDAAVQHLLSIMAYVERDRNEVHRVWADMDPVAREEALLRTMPAEKTCTFPLDHLAHQPR